MRLDDDSFRALARSSPWRWSALHFRHRSSTGDRVGGEVEAWVDRPGWLRVVTADGQEHISTGVPYTRSGPETIRPPQHVTPTYRPDGLVAERPGTWAVGDDYVDYDDPMWQDFSWVAMLDPVELSHDVHVSDCREDEVAGRPAWLARLVAEDGYDPRCGGNCCELLWSEAGLRADYSDDLSRIPEGERGRTYPEAYDVALDVETGIVVRLHPVGGDATAHWLENDIIAAG